MISNPKLVHYACIAKGTTILAGYTSKDQPGIEFEGLALQCLEKTPPHHSLFSHTFKKRTFTFLIDDPLVFFAVFDQDLVKSEGLWFLNSIRCAFQEMVQTRPVIGSNGFTSFCFQAQFDSLFRQMLTLDSDSSVNSIKTVTEDNRNPSLDLEKGKKAGRTPLLDKQTKGLKKKKRVGMDCKDVALKNKVDVGDDVNGVSRDFTLSVPKGMINERQKAKQIWKKHVWVVMLLDLFVCAVLFVVWLWICRGFKCIDD